ncbi:CLUMA_CG018774, isoform A [Clunio marinus]|uniref:CLUMA_CG018774, isoform A n=1 Tax=Clunio marinus TaxID=568069 RepID=A0A1J1J4E9_9DIPT|nr:CLUMA_CG018774, isoform A [Clunio marinus]
MKGSKKKTKTSEIPDIRNRKIRIAKNFFSTPRSTRFSNKKKTNFATRRRNENFFLADKREMSGGNDDRKVLNFFKNLSISQF